MLINQEKETINSPIFKLSSSWQWTIAVIMETKPNLCILEKKKICKESN